MKTAKNGMGQWQKRDPKYSGKKHQHTASGLGRRYIASPPPGGWPGGLPEKNGYRPGGGGSK